MASETRVLRVPTDAYKGQNGFIRNSFTEPAQITQPHEKQPAIEAHRRAMFILNHKKREVPSFEAMKAIVEQPNKLLGIQEAIETTKENHLADLQKLYTQHADEYHEEAINRYLSNDESWYQPDSVNDPSSAKLQGLLYTGLLKDVPLEAQWRNDYEQLKYAYVKQMLALQKEKRDTEIQLEIERKEWEKTFPISKEDFYKKGRDVQLRAARFLAASSEHERERMLSTYGWAWRQVAPLQVVFRNDERFAADIMGMVVADNTVGDPRKARG
ncbi:hypothetical protein HYPSUDRAFT_49700 [Hypholoma sublateritium FD-334 SS-4]|uniref:Uncharacterized protein n=1 Tax=Hypholoma sublateritium (strain FD-334 SS-4) TaxID=945553 RepID=A0A0D2LSA5_HYPSF|nr:hypothetical protein HYPSUDRAFT_49700 [Hypholoma sublateritium FD-334 SS-4]